MTRILYVECKDGRPVLSLGGWVRVLLRDPDAEGVGASSRVGNIDDWVPYVQASEL